MALLKDDDRKMLTEQFEALTTPLNLVFFSKKKEDCTYCEDTKAILDEVATLSDKITIKPVDMDTDGEDSARYGIDRAPAIVVTDGAGEDSGVRFFGIPAGYEFISLIGAIHDQGSDNVELSPELQDDIKKIDKDVHLQVFVTPTCPHCPGAARLAHQMARLNPRIKADVVEATEFPELSQQYRVMGVPRTIINENAHIEGALPEPMFVQRIVEALN